MSPIYLSGVCHQVSLGKVPEIGVLLTPLMHNRPNLEGVIWAADNGCYSQGESFDLSRYLAWLESWSREARTRCLFAVAPDVVADARATIARSLPVLPTLRELHYRAAFVAQDGLEHEEVPWDAFDVLFIGGSTEWKLGPAAADLARQARFHHKYVHMGRVNSYRRLRAAEAIGCRSVDGTFLRSAPDQNAVRLERWMRRASEEPMFTSLGVPA